MPTVFNSKESFARQETPEKSLPPEKESFLKEDQNEDFHEKKRFFHLSSYCYLPQNVKFVNQDEDEKVLLLLRKHPITNLKWIISGILMIISPFFLFVISPLDLLPELYQFAIILSWYLITSAIILEGFLIWFFSVNIITDERVLDVDFVSLFYREMTDANIDKIEDVTVDIGGVVKTFLNYGDVIIQTASEVPRITFEDVPYPDKVAKLLRELRIQEEEEKIKGKVR